MQDDVAFDRAIEVARANNLPAYTLDGNGWLIDQTGVYPDQWYGIGKEPTPHERKLLEAHRQMDIAEKNLADCRKWVANAHRILDELEAANE